MIQRRVWLVLILNCLYSLSSGQEPKPDTTFTFQSQSQTNSETQGSTQPFSPIQVSPSKSSNDVFINSNSQSNQTPRFPLLPTPVPQRQGRPPFSSFNSIENDRQNGGIDNRERNNRNRDQDRNQGRGQFQPFGQETDDSGNNRSRPDNPFTSFQPTNNNNRNRNPFEPPRQPTDQFGSNNNNQRPVTPNINMNPNINFNNNRNLGTPGAGGSREPRYFVVASRVVRPGQVYRVAVTLFQTATQSQEIEVRASLLRNGVDIGSDTKVCHPNMPETLMIRVPRTSVVGDYRLRVEGNDNGLVGGTAFFNDAELKFSQRSMTIFIQTDKPVYMQGQTVRFRTVPINTALRAFDDAVDVYMIDPKGNIVRRWLSRQSNFGAVSLNYTLSDQPIYGNWTIRIHALQQKEEKRFFVEEYYQTRFEVNVTMPAFVFDTEEYVSGFIVANYTNGAPVKGNLTIRATIKPTDARLLSIYRNSVYEPILQQIVPDFPGFYEFRFPMWEIQRSVSQLDNMEVTITASVGEHYWNEVVEGFSKARIFNSSLRLQFLGGSPQVFKPSMPYTCYLTISYHDGSPLTPNRLEYSVLEIEPEVIMRNGGRRRLEPRNVSMLSESPGIWRTTFDLKLELSAGSARIRQTAQLINDIQSLRVNAVFSNRFRETGAAELLAVAHYSPKNRHIRVTSSTNGPKVGEYIVFHVRGNFYMDRYSYLILSKGVILLSGSEIMDASIRTFAISVSPEMAPAATIVVYHVSKYNEVVADSLTFPVNGISRNNFTVVINNKKEKTNNFVEVIIRGQPGAYVGLSGADSAFYTMQAGNEISYADVLSKMINFDEDSNGTYIHKWISRDGLPDDVVYFPSHSFGIDANRTFEFSGLVVFSDIPLPRKADSCNETAGLHSCLSGGVQCYYIDRKCDGIRDCQDGTDESNCQWLNHTDIIDFKLNRINRMQRLYENVWLWKDINIGPHGHFIFTLPVPQRPALWMVSSIGVSPKTGFGLLRSPIAYSGVRPLFMNVEMPNICRQGEQIGVRVTIFNYMLNDIEVMVVLAGSPEYKFIHVEAYGHVNSYSPRTSRGEQQHLVWIKAQDVVQVHMPIVATVLGEVKVNIKVISQIAQDEITRVLKVEPDGVPQFRHTSILLDLSNRAFVLQYMHINVTESPIIPYDFDRYYVFSSNLAEISVVGDVVGPAYPTMPVNATSLLNKPMDSAEQNMFSFAANLYTLMYLRLTNQRNRTVYRQAFHHLNVGYQRQLSFQNDDGSFSLFRSDWNNSAPSVYVTAYCARVFTEASFNEWENFLFIDPVVIVKAVSWFIQFQTEEGSFYEVAPHTNRKMNDTIVREGYVYSPNITLTAHVLIALHAVKDLGVIGPQVALARQRAVQYLETKVDQMKHGAKPYETALVTYSLMLNKSPKADSAFVILAEQARHESGYAYWGRERVPPPDFKLENNKPFLLPRLPYKYDSENIEATAYALMVYVARQEILVDPIVKWLNTQRLYDGGWASTQDSAAALRALIDYTIRQKIRNVTDLTVSIEAVSLPGQMATFHVNSDNLPFPQKIHIPNAYGTVKVEAKGAGFAILQMQVQFGVDRDRFITEPPIPAFSLKTHGKFSGRNASLIEYHSCQSWTLLSESERSGMAVLEVKIPTGYFLHQPKLDQYVLSRQVPTLRRARYFPDKVILYFDYLEKNPTCVNFTIERWYPAANMTRYLPIRVYDYYAPERFNETIFDAFDIFIMDICQVCGSYQCPYCPIFAFGQRVHPSVPVIIFGFITFMISSHFTSFISPLLNT